LVVILFDRRMIMNLGMDGRDIGKPTRHGDGGTDLTFKINIQFKGTIKRADIVIQV